MVGLFDRTVQGTSVAVVLALIGVVEPATEDDRLPKWCCKGCLKGLECAYKLRMLCQDSDRKLREMFSNVEAIVVKEELEADEFNPLEEIAVECKLDVDVLQNDEEGTISEELKLPKLEIMDVAKLEDDQQMQEDIAEATDDMEDNLGADSDVDVENEGQDEKVPDKTSEIKHQKKFAFPDVFKEVPAVGHTCCGCRNKFDYLRDLKAHTKEVHLENKLSNEQLQGKKQCDVCYKVLQSDFAVQCHKQKDKLNFLCKVCGERFQSRKRVCLHHDRIHGPNPVISGPSRVCCACLEQFETKEQLKEHGVVVHLPEKPPPDPSRPFTCNVCYRCYRSDLDLYSHQSRMFKLVKKFMCGQCGMMFRCPGELRDHEVTHTGEKVFQCPKCPKSYCFKESYRKHMASHDMPADKYKCQVCGLCFKTNGGLKQHKPVHTGERPHKCSHCPASYGRISGLKSHMLTHSVQKEQKCPICGKHFKRYSEVNQHVRFYHQKQKPFACFYCSKTYPRKDYRKRHMVSAHPEELRNNPPPAIELFGNPQWVKQKAEEDAIQQ